MAQNPAVELLFKKKLELEGERDLHFYQLSTEIKGIETAIELISGKKVWEIEEAMKYDDENPNYIKGSLEEI